MLWTGKNIIFIKDVLPFQIPTIRHVTSVCCLVFVCLAAAVTSHPVYLPSPWAQESKPASSQGENFFDYIYSVNELGLPVAPTDTFNTYKLNSNLLLDSINSFPPEVSKVSKRGLSLPELPPKVLLTLLKQGNGGKLTNAENLLQTLAESAGRETGLSVGLDLDTLSSMLAYMRRKNDMRTTQSKLAQLGK